MKRNEDFRKALGQPDEYFRQSVIDTLDQLNMQAEKESRPQRRYTTRIIVSFAALVLAIAGIIVSRQYIPGMSPDGHIDVINPTPVAMTMLNEGASVDNELVTLTFRNADTDGYGVFLSIEVKPRHEKTLIVDINVDPYTDSPSRIGLTPDRSEQTILEWAVEHGFEELLDVEIFSPANDDSDPTYAACFHSYSRTPEQDGSVILDVYGSTLPNTDLYTLCCRAVPWDMNGKNIYRETPDGAEVELALLWDRAAYSYLKIPVSGEKEIPQVFQAYYSETSVQKNSFTVSLFRTSKAEYCQTWTNNPDYADSWFFTLFTGPTRNLVFFRTAPAPIHACIPQEDGSVIFRDTVILPNEYPDTLSLEFTNIKGMSQADPPVIMKKLLPVEEYSALAWALSGEGYNGLLNGMDSRDYKVYVVKGTVQEVLSEDPLRVLINTSEYGTSQPVIVECPAYCSFTWEPGTYYRIYADVSSMENNMPVLTARYSYTMHEKKETKPEAETGSGWEDWGTISTQPESNTVESDYATLKVREAKTDGYGVFLQVEVQPKEEKTLVVADSLNIRNDSVMKLGIDENKSIYQWAVDNDYQLLIVDFNSPTDVIDSDTGLARDFHPYWATLPFIEKNGSTVIKAIGYAIPDTVQYKLGFSLYSVDQDSSESPIYNLQDAGVIPVTVSETEEPNVIAEYKATSSSSADIPTPDATLTLLQSSCSDYCELRSSDTKHISSDLVPFIFMLSNDFFADGEFVEWGERVGGFMLSHPVIEDNTFVLRLFWIFPQEIPDKFRLSASSDYYSGLYEKVQ